MSASLKLGGSLSMSRERVQEDCIAALRGEIDEHFDHLAFVAAVAGVGGAVVIDLDGVPRITSYGVRAWLRAMRELEAGYTAFVRCRPSVLEQFNTVAGFACGGEVISFYAPYVCPTCHREKDVLVDLRKDYAQAARYEVPAVRCDGCGSAAVFDDAPESYLSYVARAPCPRPPAHVAALLGPRGATSHGVLSVEKEVWDTVTALWLSGTVDEKTSMKRLADGLEGVVLVLLGGLKDVTPEGFARLVGFTQACGSMLLSRVSRPVLARLALELGVRLPPVLSLQLPMQCGACGLGFAAELDPQAAVRALRDGPPFAGAVCPSCGREAHVDVTPAEAKAALALPWAEAPLPVQMYLESRAARAGKAGHEYAPVPPSGKVALTPSGRPAPPSGPPGTPSEVSGIGDVTFGKYKLVQRIGYGGMAEIFLALQRGPRGFEKKVALKRVLPHLCQDEAFVTMFLQEARLAARLSHPNIVQVLELGEAGDQYFIALEYVRGWDLRSILRACTAGGVRMPVELACRVVADVCAGLSAAHTHRDDAGHLSPIVHRDVSPQNVLVSVEGVVKLTDFGVAKAADAVHDTDAGSLKGKPSYMAPERILGTCAPLDARPDVFSAGVVLYECLAGERPYLRANNAATMHAVLSDTPPDVSSLRPDVAPELDVIVGRAMARSEDDRYRDARSLQADLERYLRSRGQTVTAMHVVEWLHKLIDESKATPAGSRLRVSLTPAGEGMTWRSRAETIPAPRDGSG